MDGVRTAFGRAGPDGIFLKTRADDMAVKVVRELLRRNPQLPPERIDDVVYAATAVAAVRAPAHIRSTANPGTLWGSPESRATSRPSVRPWSPTCAVAA